MQVIPFDSVTAMYGGLHCSSQVRNKKPGFIGHGVPREPQLPIGATRPPARKGRVVRRRPAAPSHCPAPPISPPRIMSRASHGLFPPISPASSPLSSPSNLSKPSVRAANLTRKVLYTAM
eukprot:1182639-Prorocentrum_minimum.AAC.2